MEQIERDRLAVRIFESEAVQRAQRNLAVVDETDAVAAFPDARSTTADAAAATAIAQAVAVVNRDTDRPFTYRAITSPHSCSDLHVPLSGLMIDDPDTSIAPSRSTAPQATRSAEG